MAKKGILNTLIGLAAVGAAVGGTIAYMKKKNSQDLKEEDFDDLLDDAEEDSEPQERSYTTIPNEASEEQEETSTEQEEASAEQEEASAEQEEASAEAGDACEDQPEESEEAPDETPDELQEEEPEEEVKEVLDEEASLEGETPEA